MTMLTLLALVVFAFAQINDPCSASLSNPNTCAFFTVTKIQTGADLRTHIIINATNNCAQGVFYVAFGLGSGAKRITPVSVPPTYTAKFSWQTSICSGAACETGAPSQDWLRFTSTSNPNNQYKRGGQVSWELFNFFVTGYDPVFPWYFSMHAGAEYAVVGPLDMSLCKCTDNCDAGYQQRTIQDCSLGYWNGANYVGPTNRAYSVFNENKVLYSYQIYGNLLALFYTDEFPMCLGVRRVTNNMNNPPTTTDFPISVGPSNPSCIFAPNIQFGSTNFDGWTPNAGIDGNGPNNGCNHPTSSTLSSTNMKCGRPMPPTLFVTDITQNANNRSGDWQFGGAPYLPTKVCGLWQGSLKTVTGRNPGGDYVFNVVRESGTLPASNYLGNSRWNFGAGADTPPIGFINPSAVGQVPYPESYGVEVAWNLDALGLKSKHSYRFQFLVHDGDSTKVGGDVGQACLITTQSCPAGFAGDNCDICDTLPVPKDGKWTWWCAPTGQSNPAYRLLKIPTSKSLEPPYAGSGGFVPADDKVDSGGYRVGCDCVRVIVPCPQACCGNGICADNVGQCQCINTPPGTNLTTCCLPPPPPPPPPVPPPVVPPPVPIPVGCNNVTLAIFNGTNDCMGCVNNAFDLQCAWCPNPLLNGWDNETLFDGTCGNYNTCPNELYVCIVPPPPPPPPCYNDGIFCSGHGTCVNGTCVCEPEGQKEFSGIACNVTEEPPPPTCQDVNATDCSSCLAGAAAQGLLCAWCPNSTIPLEMLRDGVCIEDYTCGTNKSMYTCVPPVHVIPPECPDNCTGHGMCVNTSFCREVLEDDDNQNVLILDNGTVYICDEEILNQTESYNQSMLCMCVNGFSGVNCIVPTEPVNVILAAALTAGIIAAIVVLGLLALALCGGGAYAATTALAAGPGAGVLLNPLYEGAGSSAENPLWGA